MVKTGEHKQTDGQMDATKSIIVLLKIKRSTYEIDRHNVRCTLIFHTEDYSFFTN